MKDAGLTHGTPNPLHDLQLRTVDPSILAATTPDCRVDFTVPYAGDSATL